MAFLSINDGRESDGNRPLCAPVRHGDLQGLFDVVACAIIHVVHNKGM